jgi:hypothetical protein
LSTTFLTIFEEAISSLQLINGAFYFVQRVNIDLLYEPLKYSLMELTTGAVLGERQKQNSPKPAHLNPPTPLSGGAKQGGNL